MEIFPNMRNWRLGTKRGRLAIKMHLKLRLKDFVYIRLGQRGWVSWAVYIRLGQRGWVSGAVYIRLGQRGWVSGAVYIRLGQ